MSVGDENSSSTSFEIRLQQHDIMVSLSVFNRTGFCTESTSYCTLHLSPVKLKMRDDAISLDLG